MSAEMGSFALLRKLLDLKGSHMTADTDTEGDTILHMLVNHANTEINSQGLKQSVAQFVRYLYESSETVKTVFRQMSAIENKAGLRPVHQFLKSYSGHYSGSETEESLLDFLRFLTETLESDINTPIVSQKAEDMEYVIHLAANCKTKSFVKTILSMRPELEQLNGKNRTPLTIAIITKNIDISKLLIESGADVKFVSKQDSNLSLLLLEAINNKKTFELIPLLVNNGANVKDFESKSGNTALHYIASRAEQSGALAAIEALVRAGADVNAKNNNGMKKLS